VLGETAIPALLEDPKLAALANSKRLSETATQADQGDMETAVTEVLLDPISVAARMKLGTLFEARGFNRHAQEQYAAVADLTDN